MALELQNRRPRETATSVLTQRDIGSASCLTGGALLGRDEDSSSCGDLTRRAAVPKPQRTLSPAGSPPPPLFIPSQGHTVGNLPPSRSPPHLWGFLLFLFSLLMFS